MAEYTEHYNLELPASTEHYDIKVANTNNQIIDEKLYEKVDKIPNKGLSTNDFTNGYKQKLDDLKNYDDTQIKKDISNMKTEITAKDNVQDNKILQLQNEKVELEKELKEAQEDFYQASVRGQASGEYIHVEDSSNCRAKIGIGGNQEQETRSGKNKIEITKTTTTVNGCTHTIKDGTDTLSGTSTGWANLIIYSFTGDGETYTLSGSPTSSKNIFISARDNTQNKDLATSKNGSAGTFVATSGNPIDIIICVSSNITLGNELFMPQLELGSNATEWEQGGASPSLDYQSPIKTVGSNINLIEETFEGYNINGNGAFEKANGFDMQIAKLKANVKYTLNSNTYVFGYYNEKPTIASITYDKSRVVLSQSLNTITPTRDGYISFRTDKTDNNKKIKLVEGTEVGGYSKYGQGCITEVICNYKNLFNRKGIVTGKFLSSDGSIGTDTSLFYQENYIEVSGIAQLIISAENEESFRIVEYDSNKTFIRRDLNAGTTKTYIITLASNCKYIRISTTINNLDSLIIQEGSTIANNKSQSYIMPVQQEMLEGDTFDWDNEEEVHIFGKKVLTGNENWEAIGTNTSGKYRFQTKVDDIAFNADGDTYLEGICDSYKVGTPNTTYLCQESIATVQNYLIIYNEKVNDTVENFEKGLLNKNVTIYYKLATPKRLKFTNEQKAVAKELNNARTYKNVTNITTDSIAILDLDYAKDLEELTEYSTEERVIGRWIDGKPLYSKVGSIKFTSVYDSSGLHTRGSLIDSDIDYGTVSKVLNKNLLSSSLFNTYGTSTSNVYVENRQGNSNKGYILGFTDRTDLLNTTIYVVVEYTKTTD